MSPENFCFWLQGLFEDGKVKTLDAAQVTMVKQHLGYVFEHPAAQPAPKPAVTPPGKRGGGKHPLEEMARKVADTRRKQNPFDLSSPLDRGPRIC